MNYSKEDIWILQLSYFFIHNYQYQFVQVKDAQKEVWLAHRTRVDYPVIRLSNTDEENLTYQRDRIIKTFHSILLLLQKTGTMLDIHTSEVTGTTTLEQVKTVGIGVDYFSDLEIEAKFPGLKTLLQPIQEEEIPEELNKINYQLKLEEQRFAREAKKTRKLPIVSIVVAAISVIVFLGALWFGNQYSEDLAIIYGGAVYKTLIYGANEWWRLLTAGFLHIDFSHIFCNLLALYNLGPMTERIYGRRNMVIILLVSIIGSSWLALILSSSTTVSFGLSGGIFGLFGAIILYYFQTGLIRVKSVSQQLIRILAINLFISLLPGVSLAGHVGGIIAGVLISLILIDEKRWKRLRQSAIVALIALFVFFGVYSVKFDQKRLPVIIGLDNQVIQTARILGLDGYAEYLEENIYNYYEEIGARE